MKVNRDLNLTSLRVNELFETRTSNVTIGYDAGATAQGADSIAIGRLAGERSQGVVAIAIGRGAGNFEQGADAIAIGNSAGNDEQGDYSIAIGSSAGQLQAANTIILNASGGVLNADGVQPGLFVKPIRNAAAAPGVTFKPLYWDPNTGEFYCDTT